MSRKPSITLVTTFYPPESFGGDGVHVQRLAHALARRDHDVEVVYSRDAYAALRQDGMASADAAAESAPREPYPGAEAGVGPASSRRLPAGPLQRRPRPGLTVHGLSSPWGRLALLLGHQLGRPTVQRRRLRTILERSDVIHYHNVSLIGGPAVLSWGRGIKLYTPHEYWLGCPTHMLFRYNREICTRRTCVRCTLSYGRPPQLWRYGSWRRRHLPGIERFLVPSRLTAELHRRMGIDGPFEVLPHFLPDDYVAAAESRGPRRADVPPYCLYVGRLDRVKGVHTVLPAFVEGRAGIGLRVVGDGPQEDALRRQAAGCPEVTFLGRVGGEELGRLYRDALALVLPSAGYEVFGLVVLEAFAHGTPVLVSDVGAAREIVADSGGGHVYGSIDELCDAVGRLREGPELRDRMGRAGRDHLLLRYREDAYVRRYEEILEEIAEEVATCGDARSSGTEGR